VKLPHAKRAQIPKAKMVLYLLSPTHRVGKSKAAFFGAYGFDRRNWKDLAAALRRHAAVNKVTETEETTFGRQYFIEGTLLAPDGTRLHVRSAWFIDRGKKEPRFISAYPLKRRSE
jgi:hypothetical protein